MSSLAKYSLFAAQRVEGNRLKSPLTLASGIFEIQHSPTSRQLDKTAYLKASLDNQKPCNNPENAHLSANRFAGTLAKASHWRLLGCPNQHFIGISV